MDHIIYPPWGPYNFSRWRGIEILGKREIGFVYLFVEMLLGVLRCIEFTMSLSKSLMWHVFIG